jgi:hypothetical protein
MHESRIQNSCSLLSLLASLLYRLQIRNIDTGEAFDNIDTFADQQVYSNYTLLPAASEFKAPAPQPKRQSLRWPGRGHKASKSITDPNAVKVDITGKGTR